MKLDYEKMETPLVTLHCYADIDQLVGLFFEENLGTRTDLGNYDEVIRDGSNKILESLKQQLTDYFRGERKNFDVPLKLIGSKLQLAAWDKIRQIPFGKTLTYSEQAYAIGKPKAVRAVASANGQNRFPLIIPCHRVLRSDGSIGGYSGGVELKEKLLAMEKGFNLATNLSELGTVSNE